jgi:hypothetical protein
VNIYLKLFAALAAAVLGTLACFECSDGRINSFVREEPVAIALLEPDPNRGRPEAGWWLRLTQKFRQREPVKSLPDLMHHIGNAFSIQMPDRPDEITRSRLLTSLLDGALPPLYQPTTTWLFRGIDGRPHMSQRVDAGAEGHSGQLLTEFAALGIPSSRVVKSGAASAPIAELVRSLREDFHLEGEIEWKTIALARYAPTKGRWVNRWGKAFDFDAITGNRLRRSPGEGSCCGLHVLQALVVIWRVDAPH